MSELSVLELETEHIELLPEREALSHVTVIVGGGNRVTQFAAAAASARGYGALAAAAATNIAIVG